MNNKEIARRAALIYYKYNVGLDKAIEMAKEEIIHENLENSKGMEKRKGIN